MHVPDLLAALSALGLHLETDGSRIHLRPTFLITPTVREITRRSRVDLISALRSTEPLAGQMEIDQEIVATTGYTIDLATFRRRLMTVDEMRGHLTNCLNHFVDTEDAMWAEAGMYWTAAINSRSQQSVEEAA